MQNKKSINLKDLIPALDLNKTFSHSVDYTLKKDNQEDQHLNSIQRRYSLKYSKEEQMQHQFLSKMRPRNGARYLNQTNQQKVPSIRPYKRQTAPELNKNSEIPEQYNGLNKDQKQKVIVGRITNFSPFGPIEQNDFYKYRNGFLFTTVGGQNPKKVQNKIKVKINKNLTPKTFKSPTSKYLTFTQKNKFGSEEKLQKNSAKVIQLNPQFNKTKIFDKKEHKTINQNSPQRLSPYQLAVKKKSLNLIQKKLKGLGKQADDVEVHQIEQLSKLFETNLMKQKFQNFLKFKNKTLAKNPIKIIHKYRRNQNESENKIAVDLNRFLTMEMSQTANLRSINLGVDSKPIQIKQNPKAFVREARSRSQQKVYRKINESQLFIRGSQIEGSILEWNLNKS